MNKEHNWELNTLTDKDLTSLKNAIYKEEDRRKNENIKTAFKAFEKAAVDLDELFYDYYHIAGDYYAMGDIVDAIKNSIQREGYDI